jgi:putative transposase
MPLIHELPGTTFSNVAARGDDASDTHAVMTLGELEHWMTVAIIDYYHRKPHTGLHAVPLERYREGIQARATALDEAYPHRLDQHRAFVIDFLPVVWRTLQRHGFMLDHIAYYSDALRSLLGRPQQGKFLIRRDPRDVSRVYVCDPDSRHYLEVPYRTLAHPSLTLWEHRQVVKRLRERGVDRVDEAAIFRAVEEMRQRTQEAAATTRTARRMAERLRQAHAAGAPSPPPLTPPLAGRQGDAKPVEDIEPWTPLP